MRNENQSLYESWNLNLPAIPARSRLDSLEPIGIRTPYTESSTGYLARLAYNHSVRTGDLFQFEIIPHLNRPYLIPPESSPHQRALSTGIGNNIRALNGMDNLAKDWIQTLGLLTHQTGLRFMTTLTWEDVLARRFLLRPIWAWCPACYEKRRNSGEVVYEPLLWAFQAVTVCPIHLRELKLACHHCKHKLCPLAAYSRPGYCSRCKQWLGYLDNISTSTNERLDETLEYKVWVANNIGELIAAAPSLQSRPSRRDIPKKINLCIDQFTDGKVDAFARLFNLSKPTLRHWRKERHIPNIDSLLKLCHSTGITLLDFLTKEESLLKSSWKCHASRSEFKGISTSAHRLNDNQLREALLSALDENPPPSLSDLKIRPGFPFLPTLRKKFPELCEKIKVRRKPYIYQYRISQASRNDDPMVEQALKSALNETFPHSVEEIAKSTVHKDASSIRQRFPELCSAIISRRADGLRDQKNRTRRELKKLLSHEPPLSITQLTKRVGYKNITTLRSHFPVLCSQALERYLIYQETRFQEIEKALTAALNEEPPPTMRQIARRIGYNIYCLYGRYGTICHQIANRHKIYKKQCAKQETALYKAEIEAAVFALYAKGIFPSEKRVKEMLSKPNYLKHKDFWEALINARRKLD